MAFRIADEPLQRTAFIVAIVGTALAILATVLRFIATKRSARKYGWEDWFAVLATFFFIAYVVPMLWQLVFLNGRGLMTLPMVDLVKVIKAGYVSAAQFCLQQLFAKLSLLFLYYRIFSSSRVFVRWCYFLGIVQLIWSIATYLLHYFACMPPQRIWDRTIPGHCINSAAFLVGGETVNSLVDFALVGLAIWIVQSLQMKTSVKLKLAAVFAFGGLQVSPFPTQPIQALSADQAVRAGVLGFVKIGQGFAQMSTETLAFLDPIWATVQQACSVICCCAPVYKPLLPEIGIYRRLRSFSYRMSGKAAAESESNIQPTGPHAIDMPKDKLWNHSEEWYKLDDTKTMGSSSSQGQSPVFVTMSQAPVRTEFARYPPV